MHGIEVMQLSNRFNCKERVELEGNVATEKERPFDCSLALIQHTGHLGVKDKPLHTGAPTVCSHPRGTLTTPSTVGILLVLYLTFITIFKAFTAIHV